VLRIKRVYFDYCLTKCDAVRSPLNLESGSIEYGRYMGKGNCKSHKSIKGAPS